MAPAPPIEVRHPNMAHPTLIWLRRLRLRCATRRGSNQKGGPRTAASVSAPPIVVRHPGGARVVGVPSEGSALCPPPLQSAAQSTPSSLPLSALGRCIPTYGRWWAGDRRHSRSCRATWASSSARCCGGRPPP
eukprot:4085432-Prymnesium_polylepis.2